MIGRLAFLAGLVISLAAGWVNVGSTGLLVLIAVGVLVGLLNVTAKESHGFLLATLVLITSGVALGEVFGAAAARILSAFVTFTAAAALVVALKEVYSVEKH